MGVPRGRTVRTKDFRRTRFRQVRARETVCTANGQEPTIVYCCYSRRAREGFLFVRFPGGRAAEIMHDGRRSRRHDSTFGRTDRRVRFLFTQYNRTGRVQCSRVLCAGRNPSERGGKKINRRPQQPFFLGLHTCNRYRLRVKNGGSTQYDTCVYTLCYLRELQKRARGRCDNKRVCNATVAGRCLPT